MIKNLFSIPLLEAQYENYQDVKQDVIDSVSKLKFTDHSYLNNSNTNALQFGEESLLSRQKDLPGINQIVSFIEANLITYWTDVLKKIGRAHV